jgi:hypothetical protein
VSNASLSFLPWVRQGAASAITTADTLGSNQSAVASVAAALTLNGTPVPAISVRLRGPADVVGIDTNQVVRTDPRPATTDFEPNCFPSIEFDRADFPWLFTPARANANAQLRPWPCLVVVQKQAGVTLTSTPDAPLSTLQIAAPARPVVELPDLKDCWAWAHAQVAADNSTQPEVDKALNGAPELSLSRLVCPRILAPETDYIACVVPTFELGRKAGLGLPILDTDLTAVNALAPAWSFAPAAPAQVLLPVYYHWEFRTGQTGDFESLVRRLTAGVPGGLGKRPIDISQPGFPAAGATTVELEGALLPIPPANNPPPAPSPDPIPLQFKNVLASIINEPSRVQAADPNADPLLAPPIYGRWHAGKASVTPAGATWLDQLNLDPRWRVAAAFGTRVVQEHQEALMASAWEQAAELPNANQRMRQLQLSMAVGEILHARHFSTLSEEMVLRIAAPAFGRLRQVTGGFDLRLMSSLNDVSGIPTEGKNLIIVAAVKNVLYFRIFDGDGVKVADTDEKRLTEQARQIEDLRKQLASLWPPHQLTRSEKGRVITAVTSIIGHTFTGQSLLAQQANSPLPVAANRSAMRRIGRQRGPLTRRIAAQGFKRSSIDTWVARLNNMTGSPAPPPPTPPPLDFCAMPSLPDQHFLDNDSYFGAFFVSPENAAVPSPGAPVLVQNKTEVPGFFRAAVLDHIARFFPKRVILFKPLFIIFQDIKGLVIEQTRPGVALPALVNAILSTGDHVLAPTAPGVKPVGVETVMAAPSFPQPMYEPLRDLSQELLLPGLDKVKPDTVLGLRTNRRLVEAYMVGLNHEMGRELLWRGYPTDQRGTYFAHFWGLGVPNSAPADINALNTWNQRSLGDSAGAPVGEEFVMLLRSSLLQRYPNAVISLAPAMRAGTPPDPMALVPDEDPAHEKLPIFSGSMQPDVSFFGFPITTATAIGTGGGLGYYVVIQEHPTEPRFGLDVGTPLGNASHLAVGANPPAGLLLNGRTWGKNAAEMAGITRRLPVRIAIHASRLITPAGFDLRLMSSLKDVSGIPTEGKNLIIVAAVNNVLHFHIFDGDGKVVVDTDEKRLTGQARQIEDLRKQLESLWPPHVLTRSDKDRVISAVTSIVGHIPPA